MTRLAPAGEVRRHKTRSAAVLSRAAQSAWPARHPSRRGQDCLAFHQVEEPCKVTRDYGPTFDRR